MEIAGGHRRTDGSTFGNDPGDRPDDPGNRDQPDDSWGDRRYPACNCRLSIVPQRDILGIEIAGRYYNDQRFLFIKLRA